jgi:tRNA nucleotidyltransferase (CCA-adding enzyme)
LLSALDGRAAAAVMERLRSARHEIQWVGTVVDRWHAVGGVMADAILRGGVTDAEVRSWVRQIGRLQTGSVMRVASARWQVMRARGASGPEPAEVHRLYRRMLRSAFADALEVRDLAIDGDDLRRAGIAAGPAMGRILQSLLAVVLEDPSRNNADWLLQEARRLGAPGE